MPTNCFEPDACETCFVRHPEQPPADLEWVTSDGIFLKQMLLVDAGMYVPQHRHSYDHTSLLLRGSIRVWADKSLLGDFVAPRPILIKAGVAHTFLSLEPDTSVLCIHKLENNQTYPGILEEHRLVD